MSDPQTERIYCAQQINIPPTFPYILKLYAKAAIRTQSYDLLRWTVAYFRALANGEVPPAKNRLEYPPFIHLTGITPGYLKTLLNRFGHVDKVCLKALVQDWRGLDLPETSLYQLFTVAGLLPDKKYCDFYRFLAVACGFLGNVSLRLRPLQNLLETMIYVCELLTHEPEGGSAMIPLRIFLDLYGYLANLDCSGEPVRRREVERADSSSEEASVSGPTSETIDSTATFCSCEFTTAEKVSLSRDVSLEETNSSDEDVCGKAPREKQAPESLEILKDHGDDPKHSDVDIVSARQTVADDKTEIEIESIHRHVFRGGSSESTSETNVECPAVSSIIDHTEHYDDTHEGLSTCDVDAWEMLDDAFDLDEGEKRIVGEAEAIEKTSLDDLKSSSQERNPRLDEAEGGQTPDPLKECLKIPTPPDPLKEFLKRMRAEVKAGRLETIFRVPGIGPPVSTDCVTAVGLWLADCARRQKGLVGPRNIRHFLCPNLDDVSECVCTDIKCISLLSMTKESSGF
ncbi:uncharacterized protein [Anoplolepis gracilipes]|uniref:uncharacterized protein n=1 Tax=Anoplolepis gracilipes TaxID=354296 RepID=UPI003BA3793A